MPLALKRLELELSLQPVVVIRKRWHLAGQAKSESAHWYIVKSSGQPEEKRRREASADSDLTRVGGFSTPPMHRFRTCLWRISGPHVGQKWPSIQPKLRQSFDFASRSSPTSNQLGHITAQVLTPIRSPYQPTISLPLCPITTARKRASPGSRWALTADLQPGHLCWNLCWIGPIVISSSLAVESRQLPSLGFCSTASVRI